MPQPSFSKMLPKLSINRPLYKSDQAELLLKWSFVSEVYVSDMHKAKLYISAYTLSQKRGFTDSQSYLLQHGLLRSLQSGALQLEYCTSMCKTKLYNSASTLSQKRGFTVHSLQRGALQAEFCTRYVSSKRGFTAVRVLSQKRSFTDNSP